MRLPRRLRLLLATCPLVYWGLTIALAAGTAAVVQRATADAAAARQRWGDTEPTLVATRTIAIGETLGPANAAVRDLPAALGPTAPSTPFPIRRHRAVVAAPLAAGEVVTIARLGRADRSPTAGLLPAHTSGVAVARPAGLPLEPGDIVDVIGAAGVVGATPPSCGATRRPSCSPWPMAKRPPWPAPAPTVTPSWSCGPDPYGTRQRQPLMATPSSANLSTTR